MTEAGGAGNTGGVATAAPEKTKVTIAVGGKAALYYLPLSLAERLGYFKDEGLNVKISDFAGGAVALRAVVGGSADVVSGAYEHTISLHAKKQLFQAFVLQGRLPQIAFGISSTKAGTIKSYKDLPKSAFQIQTKFRDEIRPRFGLMRARDRGRLASLRRRALPPALPSREYPQAPR